MKKIILLVFVIAYTFNVAQNSNQCILPKLRQGKLDPSQLKPNSLQREAKGSAIIQKVDSVVTWQHDTLTQTWKTEGYNKYISYVYDANDRLASRVRYSNYGSGWYVNTKEDFTYNSSNSVLQELYSSWSGSWTPSNKTDYTYNTAHKILSRTSAYWNWSGNNWDNSSRSTYTYDAQQNNTNELNENWNSTAWEPSYRTTRTFNANNSKLTQAWETYSLSVWEKDGKSLWGYGTGTIATSYTYQTGNGATWLNDSRENYTYDINWNPVLYTLETWSNNAWVMSARATFTIASNNITTILIEDWTGSAWVKSYKLVYTYNAAGKPLTETEQEWSGTAWVNQFKYIYTYDSNNNQTSNLNQKWQTNAWVNTNYSTDKFDSNSFKYCETNRSYKPNGIVIQYGDSVYTYYKTVIGIEESTLHNDLFTVKPNPSNGHFNLITKENNGQIAVYNLVGTLVYQGKIEGENTYLNLSTLPKGIYVLMLSQGKTRQNHKIVIE